MPRAPLGFPVSGPVVIEFQNLLHVTNDALAAAFGVSVDTVERMRKRGAPRWAKLAMLGYVHERALPIRERNRAVQLLTESQEQLFTGETLHMRHPEHTKCVEP